MFEFFTFFLVFLVTALLLAGLIFASGQTFDIDLSQSWLLSLIIASPSQMDAVIITDQRIAEPKTLSMSLISKATPQATLTSHIATLYFGAKTIAQPYLNAFLRQSADDFL